MAIGSTTDAAGQAKWRGMRAARLHAIKQDVASSPDGDLFTRVRMERSHYSGS